jgi:predicted dehydrogenase
MMLRTAVVGLGWWGRIISQTIASHSRKLRVVRGVDPDLAAAGAFAKPLGFPVSERLEDALRDPEVEAVVIATPHTLHEDQIVAAARAGKHVFAEKPLGLTLASARRSIDACHAAGVVLGIGHERRFEPPQAELRKLCETGELGTLMQIEANFSHDKFIGLPPDNWRLSPEQAPAGGMTATGIHLLDLAITLLGPASRVLAHSRTLASGLPAGDSLSVLVEFRSGASATINVMMATPFVSRFAAFGSRGWVEIRDKTHVENPAGWLLTRAEPGCAPTTVDYGKAMPVLTNLEAFADAVRGVAPYPIPAVQMLRTVAALEAVFRSARSASLEPVEDVG